MPRRSQGASTCCREISFIDELPQGDIYALGRIVHDWTEEKILKLLARIYERLPAGGALLIAEKMLADDKSGPRWAQLQSLNMLTCTEGKESAPWRNIVRCSQRSDSSTSRGRTTDSPLDAILASKPV